MNIINLYDKYFDARYKAIFELCSKIAEKSDCKIYLIGGIVRDLLLNIQSRDIDITVVGDVYAFAENLSLEANAKILSEHKDFGGIKLEIQGEKIDFTRTRCEIYPQKGHLPVTTLGCSLKEDVLRRDFTVNAIALSLNVSDFGDLFDYTNGYSDLKSGKLRILHDKSFIDDPTRIIRGLKYSARLGFQLETETRLLQEKYLENVNYDMGYNRVKNELKLTFSLNKNEILKKFINQKIYKLITEKNPPEVNIDVENYAKKYGCKNVWIIYFGLFAINEDDNFLSKFELSGEERTIILGAKSLLQSEISEDKYDIYKAFCALKTESLLILANFVHREKIFLFLDELKDISLSVNGKTLIEMGLKPSEKFKKAFDFVLREKIYNKTMSREHEIFLINQYFSDDL